MATDLDQIVRNLTAFYDLVEQKSMSAFEEQFHRFLLQLQKDGSLAKTIDKR